MKKRIIFGLLLALVLSALNTTTVFAGVIDVGNKNSDFGYSDIKKDAPTFADTQDNKSSHDASYFYVPGQDAGSQRIHANYTANTDACAACHFTHTAPGTRLLQWGSIFEACAACHDGSLGKWTYDVFAGKIGISNTRTFGGLFGSTVDEVYDSNNYLDNPSPANPTSISNHMSNGFMALSAAPGAEANSTENDIQFDCSSCHTPHGQGGNARILNPDPGKLKIDDFFPANGATYPIDVSANPNKDQFIEQLTVQAPGTNAFQSNSPSWIQGYPYNRITGIFVSTVGEPAFKFNPQDQHKGIYSDTGSVTQLTYGSQYTIDWRKGIVDISDGYDLSGKQVYAVRVPGIFVAMKITNILQASEDVKHVELLVDQPSSGGTTYDGASDPNEGINAFCGACHGKYNTQGNKAAEDYDFIDKSYLNHGSGHFEYKGAYRHQVGFKWLNQWPGQAQFINFAYPLNKSDGSIDSNVKIFTCLSCHFAHGVNDKYWYDYVKQVTRGVPDGTYVDTLTDAPEGLQDINDMKEIYGSSALKRLPNMGTCEDCHDKSDGNSKDTTDGGATYY